MNNLKTGILLTLLTLLLVFLGSALGGQQGAIIAFGFAVIMNGSAYWFSDRVVLRMYKAQEVSETQSPELYGVVSDLAQRARIPMPKVYLIPSPALNAFATGRNPEHAAVAITEGLLGTLDRHELAGVVAHELSHVKHRDILIGTLAATIAGAISMLASMAQWGAMFGGFSRGGDGRGGNIFAVLIVSIVAAFAASLVQMAISRSREYQADAGAARLLGDPTGLISALRKLELGAPRRPHPRHPPPAPLTPATPPRAAPKHQVYTTHPPLQERIRALQGMIGLRHP